MDLDQSGNSFHRVRVDLGPSLGWVETQVGPTRTITTAGTYVVQPGDSIIFVNVAGAVTIQLPNVRTWVQEPAYQPATGFARLITIKDLGNAAAHPITIQPFSGQAIDGQAASSSISQAYQILSLLPLNDMSGWWRSNFSSPGGGGSGNMVLPVPPQTSKWISSIDVGGNASLTQPAFADISGTLQVNKGGTGLVVGVANGVPFFNTTTSMQSTAGSVAGTLLGGSPPAFTATPVLGAVGTQGSLGLSGSTSGVVTIATAAAAGTWTFRLPTGPGTSGQVLQTDGIGQSSWTTVSGGGGGIPEAPTDGTLYGRLNATWQAAQPLDGDLTALAALTGTNVIYYRSAANTWTAVTISASLSFSAGSLSVAAAHTHAIGTTPIAGGVSGRFLYDNGGLFGEYTGTQATAQLDVFTSGLKGLVPASGGGTVNFLRADGTFATPAGGGNVSNTGTPTNGQWAQWTDSTHIQGVAASATPFVQKAGDTMTGNLALAPSAAGTQITLNKSASGQANTIAGQTAGAQRWTMAFGGAIAEGGSNAGSDFNISRYNDAGTFIDSPISIARNTGLAIVIGDPTTALGVATKQYVDAAAPALGAWKAEYTNASGVRTALALGANGTALVSSGAASAPAFQPVLMPNVTANIVVGYTFTPVNGGTVSSGTATFNPATGNYHYYTNNGAHTLAAPTVDCAMDIMVTNGASAGAITFSGFTVGPNTGDALAVTSGNRFIISIRRINAISTYTIKALQ